MTSIFLTKKKEKHFRDYPPRKKEKKAVDIPLMAAQSRELLT
jgi:hypothetical protein